MWPLVLAELKENQFNATAGNVNNSSKKLFSITLVTMAFCVPLLMQDRSSSLWVSLKVKG